MAIRAKTSSRHCVLSNNSLQNTYIDGHIKQSFLNRIKWISSIKSCQNMDTKVKITCPATCKLGPAHIHHRAVGILTVKANAVCLSSKWPLYYHKKLIMINLERHIEQVNMNPSAEDSKRNSQQLSHTSRS